MRFRTKLIIFFSFLSVIVLFVTGSLLIYFTQNAIQSRTQAQLESVTTLKHNQFNHFINMQKDALEELASNPEVVEYFVKHHSNNTAEVAGEAEQEAKISQLFANKILHSSLIELFAIDNEGVVDISTNEFQVGEIASIEPFFQKGKKETYVQSFYYDVGLQTPSLVIATPLKKDGAVVGVLAGRGDLNELSMLMAERSGLGETGETYLVNQYNFAVTQLKGGNGLSLTKAIYTPGVDRCFQEKEGAGTYTNYAGATVIGFFKWIPESEVCLLAEISTEEAFLILKDIKNTLVLLFMGTLVLIILISLYMSKSISLPVKKLQESAKKISEGLLDEHIELKGRDEIGELARSFEHMRQEVKNSKSHLEEKVAQRTKELNEKVEELERFNKLTVDRELKMIELKKRIEELEKKNQ